MALVSLGNKNVNLTNRAPVRFNPLGVEKGKGVLFFLSLRPSGTILNNTYFTIVAILRVGTREFETTLEGKLFPKDRRLMVGVAVPDANLFNSADCIIEVEAKNRFRGPRDVGIVRMRLEYDNDLELESKSTPV